MATPANAGLMPNHAMSFSRNLVKNNLLRNNKMRASPTRYSLLLAMFAVGIPLASYAASISESLKSVQSSKEYIEIVPSPGLVIDLRYASRNNFMGRNLYGEFNRAHLHRISADKLGKAVQNLRATYPKYQLVIFDALRPRSVQYVLWDQVKGTDKETYVANPKGGSIHNYGFALDLSVLDENGKELDMGTPYDDFTPLSQPQLETKYLKAGRLSDEQLRNRRILRHAMEEAGFIQLPVEWWHYDALPKTEVRGRYKIVE
jgi:zinc D-Ala-D-Ala dipeptidase